MSLEHISQLTGTVETAATGKRQGTLFGSPIRHGAVEEVRKYIVPAVIALKPETTPVKELNICSQHLGSCRTEGVFHDVRDGGLKQRTII